MSLKFKTNVYVFFLFFIFSLIGIFVSSKLISSTQQVSKSHASAQPNLCIEIPKEEISEITIFHPELLNEVSNMTITPSKITDNLPYDPANALFIRNNKSELSQEINKQKVSYINLMRSNEPKALSTFTQGKITANTNCAPQKVTLTGVINTIHGTLKSKKMFIYPVFTVSSGEKYILHYTDMNNVLADGKYSITGWTLDSDMLINTDDKFSITKINSSSSSSNLKSSSNIASYPSNISTNKITGVQNTAVVLTTYSNFSSWEGTYYNITINNLKYNVPTYDQTYYMYNNVVNNYYRTLSDNQVSINAKIYPQKNSDGSTQYINLTDDYTRCDLYSITSQAVQNIPENELFNPDQTQNFTRLVVVTPLEYCRASGLGNLSPENYVTKSGKTVTFTVSWISSENNWDNSTTTSTNSGNDYTNYVYTKGATVHEFGHNFSLNHANYLACGRTPGNDISSQACESFEYGDPFDVMGTAYDTYYMNAAHLDMVGWLNDSTGTSHILNVTQSGDYTISPLETPMNHQCQNYSCDIKSLKIQRSSNDYMYVEFRQPVGYDSNILSKQFSSNHPIDQGVTLHVVTSDNHTNLIFPFSNIFPDSTIAVINKGQSFTDPLTGTTIMVSNLDYTNPDITKRNITIHINIGNLNFTQPSVDITNFSHTNTTNVSGNIDVKAQITPDLKESVDFYITGGNFPKGYKIASSNTSPYEIIYNTSNLPNGQYGLYVETTINSDFQYDPFSNLLFSDQVNISIDNTGDNSPPTISTSSPIEGNSLYAPITVSGLATDNIGIKNVDIYLDNNLILSETPYFASPSYDATSYQFSDFVTVPTAGNHTVKYIAYDFQNNSSSSSIINFITKNMPPTISFISPMSGQNVLPTLDTSKANQSNYIITSKVLAIPDIGNTLVNVLEIFDNTAVSSCTPDYDPKSNTGEINVYNCIFNVNQSYYNTSHAIEVDAFDNNQLNISKTINFSISDPTNATVTPSVTPSTTITTGCVCESNNLCSNSCVFNTPVITGVTYPTQMSCSKESIILPTASTSDMNSFCNRPKRTIGDSNGDGLVDNTDYFYYVRAVNGGQIPSGVFPDFNGDGVISPSDRQIVIQELKLP